MGDEGGGIPRPYALWYACPRPYTSTPLCPSAGDLPVPYPAPPCPRPPPPPPPPATGMLNSLFNRGDATRRRNLRIRTYAVLPITEV